MSHETGQQRYRRLKRDPLRHSQIAPVHTVAPVRCRCSHARLMHDDDGRCVNRVCGCAEYREAQPGERPWTN